MSRPKLSAPAQVRHLLEEAIDRAGEAVILASRLKRRDSYSEAYDHSLSSSSTGSITPTGSWTKSDPTGDIAVSGMHIERRRRVRKAARHIQRALTELELAEGELIEMFLADDHTDPHRGLSNLRSARVSGTVHPPGEQLSSGTA